MFSRVNEIMRLFESAKRDRSSGYREETPTLVPGWTVLCESESERTWWTEFCEALRSKQLRPDQFSIRDLFERCVPNGRELAESFNPRYSHTQHSSRAWYEAAGAVMSSDFSNITGQIVYSALMEPLTDEAFPFQKLIPAQPTPFDGEKIAGIAKLGDVSEVVAEGKNYPRVGTSEDYIETPATTKRGLIVPVTKEAIFFDRTGRLLSECSQVGETLMLIKEKRAIDCLIDENRTTHRYKWRGVTFASYQAATPWINVKTSNALVDWTDIDLAEQVLNELTDPNTGEPVMVEATHIIVTKENEAAAMRIMNATATVLHSGGYATSGNLVETRGDNRWRNKYQVLSTRMLKTRAATDTDWWLGAPARYAKYMENWPITVTQAPPNSSEDFNADVVNQYKASERGEYAVVQPRVMVESRS